jgi:hypothetical protein
VSTSPPAKRGKGNKAGTADAPDDATPAKRRVRQAGQKIRPDGCILFTAPEAGRSVRLGSRRGGDPIGLPSRCRKSLQLYRMPKMGARYLNINAFTIQTGDSQRPDEAIWSDLCRKSLHFHKPPIGLTCKSLNY